MDLVNIPYIFRVEKREPSYWTYGFAWQDKMLVFNDGLVRNVRCVYGCLYVIRYIGAKGRRGYGVVALLIQVSEYVLIATQNPLFKGFCVVMLKHKLSWSKVEV